MGIDPTGQFVFNGINVVTTADAVAAGLGNDGFAVASGAGGAGPTGTDASGTGGESAMAEAVGESDAAGAADGDLSGIGGTDAYMNQSGPSLDTLFVVDPSPGGIPSAAPKTINPTLADPTFRCICKDTAAGAALGAGAAIVEAPLYLLGPEAAPAVGLTQFITFSAFTIGGFVYGLNHCL
jgi:hypothetical protein